MKRTAEEIRDAVYRTSAYDREGNNSRVLDAQNKLISALVWSEGSPDDGWRGTYYRQLDALSKLEVDESKYKNTDLLAPVPDPKPEFVIRDLVEAYAKQEPWNVEYVDAYIARNKT